MCFRCEWLDTTKADYVAYHDTQWGVPLFDDNALFEFLTLESAQAGLSWYIVLKKRDNYRNAFANFDPTVVAQFDEAKALALMEDKGIIRNRLKINAAINNAQCFLAIQKEFGSFANYQWQFVNNKPIVNNINSKADYQATTAESQAFAKDLKKRGFKFLGPTTVYAHMQACGMVNDHHNQCFRKDEVIALYSSLF